jgi:hypothetical protein
MGWVRPARTHGYSGLFGHSCAHMVSTLLPLHYDGDYDGEYTAAMHYYYRLLWLLSSTPTIARI